MSGPIVLPHPHVRIDPSIAGGSPYIAGSRVPVRRLYSFYAAGTSVERICKRYSQLPVAKILDALSFALDNREIIAADIEREQAMLERASKRVGWSPPKGDGSNDK